MSRPDDGPWLPDGKPLPDVVVEILGETGGCVHLRLSNGTGSYPRTACDQLAGIGQWWTGQPNEVNCPACLELVHA